MATAAVPITEGVPADGRVLQGSPPVAVTVYRDATTASISFLVPGREQAGSPVSYVVTPLVPVIGASRARAAGFGPGA